MPRRLGGGKGGEDRKPTREHKEYLSNIKRELRQKDKESKQQAVKPNEDAVQKNGDTEENKNLKRQKISEAGESKVPSHYKKEQPIQMNNTGFIAKTLVKNLLSAGTNQVEAKQPTKQSSPRNDKDEELEEGEI